MTETLLGPPPADPPADPAAGPPPPGVRLVRDPADKVLAGVCAGLGRSTGTDPVLWRVLIAVLAVFGGAGVVLYLLAWLLVPRAGAPESLVERLVRDGAGALPAATAVVVGLLGLVALAVVTGNSSVPLGLLLVGALVVLTLRERRLPAAVPGAAPAASPVAAWPPPVAAPPRERSPLGLGTLSSALLAVGLLLLAREVGLDGVTPVRVLAVALLVVGGGLLVGTWYGRARWLLLPGLLLALAVGAASAAEGPHGWTAGERTWVPAADGRAEYRLGVGEATLDLRGLEAGELDAVRARLGAAHLVVLVPDDLPVRLRAVVEAGEVVQRDPDGTQVDVDQAALARAGDGPPTVLDLAVRVGTVEVRRVPA